MGGHWRTDPLTDKQRDLLGSEVGLQAIEVLSKKGVALANRVYRSQYDYDDAYDHALDSVLLKVRHFDESKGVPVGAFLAYFGAVRVKRKLLKSRLSNANNLVGDLDVNWSALYDLKQRESFADNEKIHRILKRFPERMRIVIEMKYGLNGECENTNLAISKRLKVSEGRVWQILNEGLFYLRKLISEDY